MTLALPGWTRWISWLFWPAVIVVIQQRLFPAPAGSIFSGVILGLITSLVALAMYLVYRANRVINFAAAEFGFLPAVVTMLLIVENGLSWWLAFPIGIVLAALLGMLSEFLLIRRFFDSPRLVVTVATIGVAQLFGVVAVFLPIWWNTKLQSQRIPAPFDYTFDIGTRTLNANHLIALVVAPVAIVAVGALLRFTRIGIAIRAAAELPSRAALLGIPVKGLQSVVWALASVLAFLALFLRAGIYGIPLFELGLLFFLRALAALTIGRMEHLPTIFGTAIALGILQEGITWNEGAIEGEALMGAITGLVLVASLLLRRTRGVRSALDGASWQSVGASRPIPAVFRPLLLVRVGRLAGIATVALVALWVIPYSGLFGTTVVNRFSEIYTFAIILLSLGVLTGWAGQLSLGQMAFSAIGGAVAAEMTANWNWDITVAALAAGLVGAAASLVVGLPALRLRGAYLAVTTLAFGIVVNQYFLNPQFFDWVTRADGERIERKPILGLFDWSSSVAAYFVCLATLVIAAAAVMGMKNSRIGRVLVAMRDNEDGVEAYGVSAMRAKLTAFAISGFLAALSGAIYTHQQQFFATADAQFNVGVFAAAVVGGLGTVGGAIVGSLYFNGTFFWLKGAWVLFASGFGIMVVLLFAPSGLIGLWQDLRDLVIRWFGQRKGIVDIDYAEDLLAGNEQPADDAEAVTA